MSIRDTRLCSLCDDEESKYCCPRCGIFYCSLSCYKSTKHQQCSESFYEDCVKSELANNVPDRKSERKMLEILSRVNNIDELNYENDEIIDSDDDNDGDLEKRIKNIDLNDAEAIWDALNDDERNEFQAIVQSSNIDCLLEEWKPWWTYRQDKNLIIEVDQSRDEELVKALQLCPSIMDTVDFNNISKSTQPVPNLKFNILNVISAFAVVARYFGGDYDSNEAVVDFISICMSLDKTDANFDDAETAVEAVAQDCLSCQTMEISEGALDVMKHDIYLILKGLSKERSSHYIQCCLSEVHKIIHNARKRNKKNPKISTSNKFREQYINQPLDINKLKRIEKKVEYYLSYVKHTNLDLL